MPPLSTSLPSTSYRPRGLQHFDDPGLVQMITFRLHDALPGWDGRPPRLPVPDPEASKLWFRRYDGLLDEHHGACLLAQPAVADIVRDAILFGVGERYELYSWVIMPNHVHLLLQTRPGWTLSQIMQTLKGYSARQINLHLGQRGPVWQKEYYDRYMRNQRHFWAAQRYIEMNPVKAGLVDAPARYEWSSGVGRDRRSPDPST